MTHPAAQSTQQSISVAGDRVLANHTHQNRETGAWPATSMNKRYSPGSMQELFLQDAATAFAAAALLEPDRR